MTNDGQDRIGSKPTLIAVGGGKGGVGKSVVSVLTGQWLALLGQRTVVVDLDLSGANIHTLLAIRDAPRTLADLFSKRADSLEELALPTATPNLRIVCGASENLAVANPFFAQKLKIMKKLTTLDADFVVMDLGAGTSFDVLDFFLLADRQIAVTTPEPIALYNAYGFLRNAVFRQMSQLTRRFDLLRQLVHRAMDPQNSHELKTVKDLFQAISQQGGERILAQLRQELARIQPALVVNQVRDERDLNAFQVIHEVARKYLLLEVGDLGGVVYDRQIKKMVASMEPLTRIADGGAFESTYNLATALLCDPWGTIDAPDDEYPVPCEEEGRTLPQLASQANLPPTSQ